MQRIERIRQAVHGLPAPQEIERLEAEGWKLVAFEWEREAPREDSGTRPALAEQPPFGSRIAKDCSVLEEDPQESEILAAMMELIIQDGPYSSIAHELNQRGYRTREGSRWNPISVFKMLPRLIEAGPRIFSSEEWHRRSQAIAPRVRES